MNFRLHYIIALLLITISTYAGRRDEIKTEDTRSQHLFVLKANRELVGAVVEVTTFSGSVVTTGSMKRRKMVIDFSAVRMGTYMIRVRKGSSHHVFVYTKK